MNDSSTQNHLSMLLIPIGSVEYYDKALEVPNEDYRTPVSNPAATMSFLTLVLDGDYGVSLKTVQGSRVEEERT